MYEIAMKFLFPIPFIGVGAFIMYLGLKQFKSDLNDESVTTAKMVGKAKELGVADATDMEMLYHYEVDGKTYDLIVTPGDKLERVLGVAYNNEYPEYGRVYYKVPFMEKLQLVLFGGLFFFVGIFVMIALNITM